MTNPLPLLQVPAEPQLLSFESEAKAAAAAAWGWKKAGLTVRVLRGQKMRTYHGLLNEVAAALQFPYYFGENWPALNECLADMDWLPTNVGIVVMVRDAGEVLADESDAELEVFVRSIANASNEYSKPVELGEWWDRPAVPFHVVLQSPPGDVVTATARWSAAGADVVAFES